MSVDQPFPSPPELPQEVPAVAAPFRKPFPGIWGAIALCLIFLASQMFGSVAFAFVAIVIGGMQAAEELMMLGLGPINIAAFALTMLVGLLWGGLRWSEVVRLTSFHGVLLLPIVIAAVGIGILASELDNLTRFILPMPDFIAQLHQDMVSGGVVTAIALVVVAPLTEELLFRGLILRGFLQRYGTVPAILLSALLSAPFDAAFLRVILPRRTREAIALLRSRTHGMTASFRLGNGEQGTEVACLPATCSAVCEVG
ncbi:MAG: CPBP family intramembrane metalloprotease [Pirellulaceae bacterium]|nr:CPBP family intramembrane metalloprotease [Pirellulaceae bacterium]